MKNILTIFRTDLHNIRTRKAAIIVVIALMILPSMYAWFNILPSWDPYANTADVAVAVVNKDQGATVEGKSLHVGDDMIESLRNTPSLGWQFVTEEEALEGVEYGNYYATIIIPEDFTEKLTSVLSDTPEQPVLDYYINEKINAIAPKVASAGASGIVEQIQSRFVKVANEVIFTAFNEVGIELQANRERIEKFKHSIYQLKDDLPEIKRLLDRAGEDLTRVEGAVNQANEGIAKVEEVTSHLEEITRRLDTLLTLGNERVQTYIPQVLEDLQVVQTTIQGISGFMDQLPNLEGDMDQFYEKISSGADQITARMDELQALLQVLENMQQNFDVNTMTDQLLTNLSLELNKTIELKRILKATILSLENGESFQEEIEKLEALDPATLTALENVADHPAETIGHLQRLINQLEEREHSLQSLTTNVGQLEDSFGSDILSGEIDHIRQVHNQLDQFNAEIMNVVERVKEGKVTIDEARVFIEELVVDMNQSIEATTDFLNQTFRPKYTQAYDSATTALTKMKDVITQAQDYIPKAYVLLERVSEGVIKGTEGLVYVKALFPEAEEKVILLARQIQQLEEKGDLDQLIHLLKNDPNLESDFFANPIHLNEHELFPIPNYGSAMAPFFTALSLWVGGLILVSSLFVDVPNKHRYKSYEAYLGRLLTFWTIGLAQALIVTAGNLFLLKTFVAHKVMILLFSFLISTAFVIIVYTFVSVFGNTGKVIAIILLVMQLGASGGTFPIQMTPMFFQKIHGFLPFTHALGILREAVGGIIWAVVWKHAMWLIGYSALFLAIGIKLKERINKSTDKFLEEARESEIIS